MLRVLGLLFLIQVAVLGAGGVWLWSRLPPSPAPVDWRPIAKKLLDKNDCEGFWQAVGTAERYIRDAAIPAATKTLAANTACMDPPDRERSGRSLLADSRLSPVRSRDHWHQLLLRAGNAAFAWDNFAGPIPVAVRLREAYLIATCSVPFGIGGAIDELHEYVAALDRLAPDEIQAYRERPDFVAMEHAAGRCSQRTLVFARRFSETSPGPRNWLAAEYWVREAAAYPADTEFWTAAQFQRLLWSLAGHFDRFGIRCPDYAAEILRADRQSDLAQMEGLALAGHSGAAIEIGRAYLSGQWLDRSRMAAAYWAKIALEEGTRLPAELAGLLEMLTPEEGAQVAAMLEGTAPAPEVEFPDYTRFGTCPSWE